MKKLTLISLTLILMLLLAACSGSSSGNEPPARNAAAMEDKTDDVMMDDKTDDTMMDDKMDEAMMDDKTDVAMMEEKTDETMMDDKADDAMLDDKMDDMADRPAWQHISLTNVRTGETFTLADFASKTVFVEPMATWCSNCRRQLGNVSAVRSQFGEDVVFIALSVETALTDAELKAYTDSTGFDWIFAVATPELLRELAALYGQTVVNPPSTPHFIIRTDGSTTDLATGIKSVDTLAAAIREAQ